MAVEISEHAPTPDRPRYLELYPTRDLITELLLRGDTALVFLFRDDNHPEVSAFTLGHTIDKEEEVLQLLKLADGVVRAKLERADFEEYEEFDGDF